MKKGSNKIYLSYGSNLNLEQMKRRCPYAVPLGVTKLSGYSLLFRGGTNSAVATIEPDDYGCVPALLWEITPRCEETLDRFEGWPDLYRKEMVMVTFNSKQIEAMLYIINGQSLGQPSKLYLNVIREGYISVGFDTSILDEAVEKSVILADNR